MKLGRWHLHSLAISRYLWLFADGGSLDQYLILLCVRDTLSGDCLKRRGRSDRIDTLNYKCSLIRGGPGDVTSTFSPPAPTNLSLAQLRLLPSFTLRQTFDEHNWQDGYPLLGPQFTFTQIATLSVSCEGFFASPFRQLLAYIEWKYRCRITAEPCY